ncbi:uncharacterized protein [Physcomitrium patens]|uniref:Hemerythrin class glutathione S-transferase n=1 Tax=Physcomitrium patens TaxID=3218 RepID=K9Y311_PHYPA|nr:uncharacterized protein LOC112280692 [Physcomitrium patens]XP_024372267.1 uncharacterized protein LOC112280692 [Physcomitrium patens]XP_024372268.1 uncharacterized protein LOC112280692 [Physcomitrium patens]XP_024372269.1 uncharacterized protein LOC112280692 [Physcomitrium patens]AFZ39150.1 hemerythrin class glutathione S-transferase [Physcomitrium patens]PNR57742.1 hypothetical protein PHYPA_004736 [Physcomitrium patens]|eukprot:XP_024372266.1 uncharacterized protein LOC112280692 [Physcomitrella patens]
MGGCCQKQVREHVETSKQSAVVPSWASSPAYEDEGTRKVKLVGDVTCPYTQRVRIALLEKGVPVEASLVMPDDLRGCKGEDLGTISPDGKFPVFQHGDRKITGSVDSILAYVEENFENSLLPNGLEKEVAQWVSYIRDHFSNVIEDALHNGDPYAQDSLEARLNESLAHLDSGLELHHKEGKHFLGSKFTLVDVYLIPFLSLMDLITYIRGFAINPSYSRLCAYKSAMCTFKCYKPVQVGTELSKTILVKSSIEKPSQPMVCMTLLQHKSILRHLDAFVKLVKELDSINRKTSLDSVQRTIFGTRLKEVPKLYGRLLELLQEHAQMEERIIFPALETADQALTESAIKDHARDLPVMNGIREDIKGIMSLRQGNFDHREALSALARRVEAFEVHAKEHFQGEEKEQLPLLEAAGFATNKQQAMLGQSFLVMEVSHSRLLPYLLEALKPHEVHQYLGIMKSSTSDTENCCTLPKIAQALNNDEFEYVRKVALDRIPSLGPLQHTKLQYRPSMARG